MSKQTILRKASRFFLTKVVSVAVIIALVAFIEWLRFLLLDTTNLPAGTKALIVALSEAFIATVGYIILFKALDKRSIDELNISNLIKNAGIGFLTGIILQSLFILVIYLARGFLVMDTNSISAMVSPFAFALSAGFVAEIIMIGIVFRSLEEQTGTVVAIVIFIILFAVLHVNIKGATFLSVGATVMQAGYMLPAAYIFSRSLWLPIFLHLGWDFAEPGIFGAINSSTSISKGLFISKISGAKLLTGGQNGPQDSLQALLLCLLTGTLFLFLAWRRNNLIKKDWEKRIQYF